MYIQPDTYEILDEELIIRDRYSTILFNCDDAYLNEIPVDSDYHCYPEPMGHPLRDWSLGLDDSAKPEYIEEQCQNEEYREFFDELRWNNETHNINLETCKEEIPRWSFIRENNVS